MDPDDSAAEGVMSEESLSKAEKQAGSTETAGEPAARPKKRKKVAAETNLRDPGLYLNREWSLQQFHRRVFEHAADSATPLLERLRFLTIVSMILDEFYEVRVARHKQQVALGIPRREVDGKSAPETLAKISLAAHELVDAQYRLLNKELDPALAGEGIHLLKAADWSSAIVDWARAHFAEEVLPVLTPVGLDPAHPFPKILNKSLNFIVSLKGKDAFGRSSRYAVVQAPRSLPRVISVPHHLTDGRGQCFILLSALIHAHVADLFTGMKIQGCYQFRVTRNSDLWVEEEDVDDLLDALAGELPTRGYGAAVRLEVGSECPDEMVRYLQEQFRLEEEDTYRVDGPVNLTRLAAIYDLVARPNLKYPGFVPGLPRNATSHPDPFTTLRNHDILLHHPYQSFSPVLDLLRHAAQDPQVLAIKLSLYRTGVDSPVVDALLAAARAGKEVTAVVELRARFDEEANIGLATRLQTAGANLVYGIVGFKTHCKMLLIVRKEGRELRRYVQLGTGNYHTGTARAYTDLSYLTADPEIGEDVHSIFQQLTGLGKVTRLNKLLQSPFTLKRTLLEHIKGEEEMAKAGKRAHIMARMNSLSDPTIIRALYRAGQAGVTVELIVRGVCCLRPGVPGVSDNIHVRSVVGRFLEHSRVFYFHAGGEEHVFGASADWMPRNLNRRVESCFPVTNRKLKARVVAECLKTYLKDNQQAWELQPDGSYRRLEPNSEPPLTAQNELLSLMSD